MATLLGFLSTPLVPVDVEPEALDTSNEEAGFRDDSTLEEVQDADGLTLEAIVELAKHPCRFNSIIFRIYY